MENDLDWKTIYDLLLKIIHESESSLEIYGTSSKPVWLAYLAKVKPLIKQTNLHNLSANAGRLKRQRTKYLNFYLLSTKIESMLSHGGK